MTAEEIEEEIKDIISDYIITDECPDDVDIAINMQIGDKWVNCRFEIEIDIL